jgi:hypothetical protein
MQTESTLVVAIVAVTTITMGMAPLGASQGTEKTQQEPATPALAPTENRGERDHRLPLDADRPHDGVDRPDRLDDEAPVPRPNPNQRQAQPAQGPAPDEPGCLPHPPIRITEDEGPQGFILGHEPATGQPIYRPGSGVVDGDGTAEDPYVIEGWCFAHALGPQIHLVDTSAHVRIQGNLVVGPGAFEPVRLDHAENVTFHANTIEDTFGTIEATGAPNLTVTHNSLRDISGDGLSILDSPDVSVENNTFSNMDRYTLQHRGPDARIANNTVEEANGWGFTVGSANGTVIRDNRVEDGHIGLWLTPAGSVSIVDNVFEGFDSYAIEVDYGVEYGEQPEPGEGFTSVEVHGNHLLDSAPGLLLDSYQGQSEPVDARRNWWGHETGPDFQDAYLDTCDGWTVHGNGTRIEWDNSVDPEICVDPWLTEPNPDAGAGT